MKPVYPLMVGVPAGVEMAVLVVFVVLGGALVVLQGITGSRRLCGVAAVHWLGGMVAVMAGDLMTLLIGWELLTFSAFILIRGSGGREQRGHAMRYVVTHVSAAVLYFSALVVQVNGTGTLAVQVLVPQAQYLMAAAVLIKTATVPLHRWLVQAYPSTPPLVTPLLSVFTTKVGVVTAARLVRIAPGGYPVLALVGAMTAVVAVIFALQQHYARRLLAWHIVSQVGYMTAGIGLAAVAAQAAVASLAAAPAPAEAVTAGLFHLVTHTVYKALLLLVAAEVVRHVGHEALTRMEGLRFRRPVLLVCAIVGALSISGFPFTSGHASKYLLKGVSASFPAVNMLLLVASVGTGLSFIKFIYLIFFGAGEAGRDDGVSGTEVEGRPAGGTRSGLQAGAVMAVILMATAATVLMGFFPAAVPGVPAAGYHSLSASLGALAPLAGSVVLWVLVRRVLTRPAPSGVHHSRNGGPAMFLAARCAAALRMPVHAIRDAGPQIQVFMILAVFGVLVFVLLHAG